MADDFLGTRVNVPEALHDLFVRHGLAGDRLRRVVVIGDDEVEHLPARQRVMHDVAFRPGPQRRRVPAQIFRHLLGRNHRAVRRMPGHKWRSVRDHLLADVRPQPVGADQKPPRDGLAIGEPRRHRRAILVVADHLAADAQFNQLVLLAGAQENTVQVAAMHHRIGIAEARTKRIAEIDMGDFLGRQRIHQPKLIDIDRHASCGFANAEIVEGVKRVGPELDTGADFAELRGLFQQDRADAFLRETKRYGEPADSATCDQNRPCVHQFDFPRCSSASSARSGTREASLLRSTSCVISANRALRSAGFKGCSILNCARSTEGMMSRSMAAPDLVRWSNLTRLSSREGLRSISALLSSRSITLPSVERSNAITADSRVASMPGWVWIATSAAYCTGVRSNALHSSTKIETAICCIRRNR